MPIRRSEHFWRHMFRRHFSRFFRILLGITVGPDGALWFTETAGNNIGRITTSGAITEYPAPTTPFNYSPGYIVTGPDGELWFTTGDLRIGEAVIVTASLQANPSSATHNTALTFTGNMFTPGEKVLIYTSGVGSAVLTGATAGTNGAF